jgi:hypothetical protein
VDEEAGMTIWTVIYGNYYPREVDSYWATKEEAQVQADKLRDEMMAAGLGSGMWEIEEIQVGTEGAKQRLREQANDD